MGPNTHKGAITQAEKDALISQMKQTNLIMGTGAHAKQRTSDTYGKFASLGKPSKPAPWGSSKTNWPQGNMEDTKTSDYQERYTHSAQNPNRVNTKLMQDNKAMNLSDNTKIGNSAIRQECVTSTSGSFTQKIKEAKLLN